MADYLLHALWVHHAGLHLWIEQVDGHRVLTPGDLPSGAFCDDIQEALNGSRFSHRLHAILRTPKGRDVTLTIPTAAFAPEQAVQLLHRFEKHREVPLATGTEETSLRGSAQGTLAADIRWLIHAREGISEFARYGRVAIGMEHIDGQWWPQWQLADGLRERLWIADMMRACPGVLLANNTELEKDLSHDVTHWTVASLLAPLALEGRSTPWHDFTSALLHSEPVRRAGASVARRLVEWRETITSIAFTITVVVEEPDGPGLSEQTAALPDDLADAANDGETPAAISEEALTWPVRLRVRSDGDDGADVEPEYLDRASQHYVWEQRRRIAELAPELGEMGWTTTLTTAQLVDFVAVSAPRLNDAGIPVLLPRAWTIQETVASVHTSAPDVEQRHLGMDTIVNFDWRVSVGGEELSDEEMRRLVDSASGLVRVRGEWVRADSRVLRQVRTYINSLGTTGEAEIGTLRQLALESTAEAQPLQFRGTDWAAALVGGADAIPPAPERLSIPNEVRADLRPYQRRGVDWLAWMSFAGLGAVLADDMGLGKTLQLLAVLQLEKAAAHESPEAQKTREKGTEQNNVHAAIGPSLVMAPTSVVSNWVHEARRFTPELRVYQHHGSQRCRGEDFRRRIKNSDVVITSYGIAVRDASLLAEVQWDHVVLDEAQQIKNTGTRTSQAVRALPARHRIALTGTPVENRLEEMRALLDFCNPGILGSASFFRNHFARPIERAEDKALTDRLRCLTSPFILRRLKTDPAVIEDLPEKTEEVLRVPMTAEQAALYRAFVESITNELENPSKKGIARKGIILRALTRIKQICNHPAHYLGDGSPVTRRGRHRSGKVRALMELLEGAMMRGERTLIFTQYRAFGALLQPYLGEVMGQEVPFYHGGLTSSERDKLVEMFQSPGGPPAMIISLKAGGTGLNLTAANNVVHLDRWWNPAVENQATDRAYRIGQQKNVQVTKMITIGTLEESIQDILDGKVKLAGAVVGEGEGWITELSTDDLASLMNYRAEE